MATIGNATTAQMLHTYFDDGCVETATHKRSPNGFRRVGAGAYRAAILDKSDNVVYKIGNSDCNLTEAKISRAIRRKSTKALGFSLRIPHSRTYRVKYGELVGVQEFAANARFTHCTSSDSWMNTTPNCNCKGRSTVCFDLVHDRIREFTNVEDIHSGNILVDDKNVFWLIDMGEDAGEY